jgi:hypothetical protein
MGEERKVYKIFGGKARRKETTRKKGVDGMMGSE